MSRNFSTQLPAASLRQIEAGIAHVLEGVRSDADRRTGASARNILILCDFHTLHTGTIRDHIAAFKKHSVHRVYVVDMRSAAKLRLNLDMFDVVVLHYSFVISSEKTFPKSISQKVREFDGYKILFIQDEYRWVDRTANAIASLGIDLVYSVMDEVTVKNVYHHASIDHVRYKTTLAGFVPEELTSMAVPNYGERRIDIGYRARRASGWFGQFSQEKWWIGQRFEQDAKRFGLNCDIEHSELKRLYADNWVAFVSNCKAMLGTESGASFIDFSGDVQPAVEAFEAANPNAKFEEIRERFLRGRDGEIVIRAISPRCFEAAALRTLMILYPGCYSGVLQPWQHYVPLARDHSNMDEVVAVLRDPERAGKIIDAAYEDVALNPQYSFRRMVEEFDRDIFEIFRPRLNRTARAGQNRIIGSLADHAATLENIEQRVKRKYGFRYVRLVLYTFTSHYVRLGIRTILPSRLQSAATETARSIARRLRSQ